jgi:deferrochelatase/peroxidase EfeB
MDRLSRRRFLTAAGASAGAVVVGGATVACSTADEMSPAVQTGLPATGVEPFYGPHQAGIATPQQDRLLFASFDLTTASKDQVVALLQKWTAAAARLTKGLDVGEPAATDLAPPTDTGEAAGLDPGFLTLTFGFGPTVFTKDGIDRFGLAASRPAALVDLPVFSGHEQLDPDRGGGDLCIQACSNDPQVAYHAVRNLARIARGSAVLRWTQEGFGRTSATTTAQVTPRNLMGFKDGTNNLKSDSDAFGPNVWVDAADGSPWMTGGSYLVVRRIRILIEVWDRSALGDQEATIGRTKQEGAPIGGHAEHDPVDLNATGQDGLLIAEDAHIRLANQDAGGNHFLRRGYSFTDGVDPQTGQLEAGLFFLAYQRDPRRQFIPMQQTLAQKDALNEYIKHVGSAIFAVPPGVPDVGHFVGEALFG